MRRLSTEYPFACVTCEAEIAGQAVFLVGLPFCCAGCAAGGPCICSYDEEVPDHDPAGGTTASAAALADDTEAWLTLVDELGRLRADVSSLAGELAHGVADFAVKGRATAGHPLGSPRYGRAGSRAEASGDRSSSHRPRD